MARPDWDTYFLEVAKTISIRSDCERSRVGAVVVKERRIRGTGYNGAPAGKPGCSECPRLLSSVEPGSPYDGSDSGRCHALHAEENSLIYCDRDDLVDATIYITREPCFNCLKLITGSGVNEVVWPGHKLSL